MYSLQDINKENSFQSTPSAWRETICGYNENQFTGISIHSLRMEGDRRLIVLYSLRDIFQSTPSAWRETYSLILSSKLPNAFQSTPSAWRETFG